MAEDWNEGGVRVGIEVHQQLLITQKLFCACPPEKSEELPFSFTRRLRPAQSELGRTDPAALFEFSKGKANRYLWNPETACLVDADEEPPHQINPDALEAALLIASTLRAHLVDEVHVMRKIVIDGSNTTGFQRTAVVGLSGSMEVGGTTVGVQSVTVEEDAARILGEDQRERRFALDRLGVPLVEVSLDPVPGDPELVGKVALHLGRILRSTGRVARGLGTIRQDLNVSTAGGKVVEVKGVQKLNLVPKVVAYEAKRQRGLMRIREKFRERGLSRVVCETVDVTNLVRESGSRILRDKIAGGGIVLCVIAKGLGGLLGWEPFPGVRLGREVAEVARANSLGGVVHSDEFHRQGITEQESARLMRETKTSPGDALILLAGEPEATRKAAIQVGERLAVVHLGVVAETRAATEDGETRYLRPRPGSERMYPETDIPDIVITKELLLAVRKKLPEDWNAVVQRLATKYGLSRDLALKVYDADLLEPFEGLAKEIRLDPSVIAATVIELPVRLSREGVPEDALTIPIMVEALKAVSDGRVAKEAIPEVLRTAAQKGLTVSQAIDALGLSAADDVEITSVVESVLARNGSLVAEKGEGAFSPLMGEVMNVLRGRADGAKVGIILKGSLRKTVTGT